MSNKKSAAQPRRTKRETIEKMPPVEGQVRLKRVSNDWLNVQQFYRGQWRDVEVVDGDG